MTRRILDLVWLVGRHPRLWDALRTVVEGPTHGDRDLITRLATEHPGEWLDVGCGTGRYASLFEPCCYLGIELEPRRVALARSRHPVHHFEVTRAEGLLREGRRFEGIVLAQVLHHLTPTEDAPLLRVCRQLLAREGTLILIEWAPPSPDAPWPHNLWHLIERERNTRSTEQWAAELHRAGFVDVTAAPIHNPRFDLVLLVASPS